MLKFLQAISIGWCLVMAEEDFCKTQCGQQHVLCFRRPCGVNPKNCGSRYLSKPLTDEEIEVVVELHNFIRRSVAFGRFDLPEAANMPMISYSRELEFMAQCWANNCDDSGSRDPCRLSYTFGEVGQNIYVNRKYLIELEGVKLLKEVVNTWMMYEFLIESDWIHSFPYSRYRMTWDVEAANFAQMISAETRYLGCGKTYFGTKLYPKFIIVCNYAPMGLVQGGPMYIAGEGCSLCRENEECNENSSWYLCGKVRSLKDDTWKPPFGIGIFMEKLKC